MAKFESTIFNISLLPFRRLMILLGIIPCLYQSTSKIGVLCGKLTAIILHFIAVFSFTGYLIHEHLKRMKETIYNLDDVFSSVMDGLGFSTLMMLQSIIHLESSWKLQTHEKIFQKFEQMRVLLLQKFAVKFDYAKLKFYASLLQVHGAIYCGFLLLFMLLLVLSPVPTMRLLLCLYAEFVLKVKMFEFIIFVIVFMVMLFDVCKAAYRQCRLVEATRFADSAQRQKCLSGFIALQDLHALLWENVQHLTDYFEWSLPGLFVKKLIDLTLLAYWAFLNTEIGTSDVIRYYLIVFWIMQILTLMVACYLCSMCERYERKLRTCFRSILKDRQNPLLMRCLHRISLQLWQEPIAFVAGHFVTINMGTLGKYIFTVAMYIVILIQFRMSV